MSEPSELEYFFSEEIDNILDDYKQAVDRRVCAEVDAGCCQTKRDYRHRDAMMDAEGTAREEAAKKIAQLIEHALDYQRAGIISLKPKEVHA